MGETLRGRAFEHDQIHGWAPRRLPRGSLPWVWWDETRYWPAAPDPTRKARVRRIHTAYDRRGRARQRRRRR